MAKLKTQGTELYMTPDGGTNIYKIGYITSISGLGGGADQIDVTHFDSAEREYERGFLAPGQVTISIVYDTSDPSFAQLTSLRSSGAMADWLISSPGTAAPSWSGANGRLEPGSGRRGLAFKAYVADMTWSFETNEVWRVEVTLQRSGSVALVITP
jgi:hypothetical protein